MTARPDPAAEPSARTLAAEERRRFRELLEAGSLGTPGARAMRRCAAGHALTPSERAAAAAELEDLEGHVGAYRHA